MKKMILIALTVIFILSGCASTKANQNKPAPGSSNQGIISNNYKFERVTADSLPKNISEVISKSRDKQKIVTVNEGEYTYIIALMGEKPTGGYAVKVNSIEDNEEGKLKITVEFTKPEPGSMVTQAITYPLDIVRIRATNLPVYGVDTQGNKISIEDLR